MKDLNKYLMILSLGFIAFLTSDIFLQNVFINAAIFIVSSLLIIYLLHKQNFSLRTLLNEIRELSSSLSFRLNESKIKNPTLKEITASINKFLNLIYNKYMWKIGIIDAIPICLIITDKENKILYVNQEIIDFIQQDGKPEDFIGMSAAEFFYGDPNHPTITAKAYKEKKKIIGIRTEIIGRKGKKVYTEVNASPLYNIKGDLIGSFAIFSDMSDLKTEKEKVANQATILRRAIEDTSTLSLQLLENNNKLSGLIKEVNDSMDNLRSRTEEVATAMEQMNASILEISRNAASTAESAEHTNQKAQEGTNALYNAIEDLKKVKNKALELQNDMEKMEKQAEDISEIINTITDIADQTNLLALNAAIEAARAGDAGRGFAVVADEVRKLAEKTMAATKEVEQYIHSIQKSAKNNMNNTRAVAKAIVKNMTLVEETGNLLKQMVELSISSMDQIRSIATAAEEQSTASEQITKSVEEVNHISQETNEIMSKTTIVNQNLAQLVEKLNNTIKNMKNEN